MNDGDSQGAELLIKWLDRRAQLLVEKQWPQVHKLAFGLLEHEKLTGEQVNVCVGAFSGSAITTGTGIITIGAVTGVHSIFGQVDNRTYIANILGAVDTATAEAVYVDADGRLGTGLASAGPESRLPRPTTPKGVRPQGMSDDAKQAMLNLKVQKLQSMFAQQQKQIETLTSQLKEQTAQIQKVSAQLELDKSAPETVSNIH